MQLSESECKEIFGDNDVHKAFQVLLQELEDCWRNTDVTSLQNVCIRETRFSLDVRDKIENTHSLGKNINLLSTIVTVLG